MLRFLLPVTLLTYFITAAQIPQWWYPDSAQRFQKIASTQATITSLFNQHAAANHLPGLAFGVMLHGKWVYTGTTGYSNVEQKIPVTPQSVFRMASMTKSFTAMAVLQLRDRGKLNLDDAAQKWLPQLAAVKLPGGSPALTIRHLLTHGGGLPQDDPWGDRQLADTDAELVRLIQSGFTFSTVPGTAYEYSNLGYALLGKIVSAVSGQPYQQYITQNILKPLGMNQTYWEWKDVPKQQLANGYRWMNGEWQPEVLLSDGVWGAMGGLMTTLDDFGKYMAFHLAAWTNEPDLKNPVLKKSSLREMQSAQRFAGLNPNFRYATGRVCAETSAYGFGLRWTTDCSRRITTGHSGGLPGFGSNWTILPEYGLGVVAFGNVTYAPFGGYNPQILDTLVALSGIEKRQLKPSAILLQRQKELAQLLPHWRDAPKQNIFAENFFLDFPIDSLRKEATEIFNRMGAVKKVQPIVPLNNLRGRFLVEGEKGTTEVFFTLTPQAVPMIQDYRIRWVGK